MEIYPQISCCFSISNSNSSSREGITNINAGNCGIGLNNQKYNKNKTKRKKFAGNMHYDGSMGGNGSGGSGNSNSVSSIPVNARSLHG